jgi:phospholipid-binding lipoprotein MlaA
MQTLSSHFKRLGRAACLLLAVSAATLLAGCATTASRHDPFEAVNRKVFSFNEGLDRAVLKPAATAYRQSMPRVVQTGVTNFFSNLRTPWSSVNLLLQGRIKEGVASAARFGTNTTVGLLGLVDVARHWGMPHRSEDFGLTLDTWGVASGPYLVLPVFGPSNLRDAFAMPVDSLGNPLREIDSAAVRNTLTAVQAVSKRSDLLEAGELLDQAALDKYVLMRDAHQRRRNRAAAAQDTGALSSGF